MVLIDLLPILKDLAHCYILASYCFLEVKTMLTNVIIFGATGMVGHGILLQCLESDQVQSVVMVNRTSVGIEHDKLTEIIHKDFFNMTATIRDFPKSDACFYSVGVSSVGKNEEQYTKYTLDMTMHIANQLALKNPDMTFSYVSADGADSSEKKGSMWARVRGKLENELTQLPFKNVYIFRPGYIQPMKGVKSKVKAYNILYSILSPISPLVKYFFGDKYTTTVNIGNAMINIALEGYNEQYLDSPHINMASQISST